jgi:hypothetical protein
MATLRPDQCWQIVGSVDISRAQAVLDRLPFKATNVGSTNPRKCPCYAVPLTATLPAEIVDVVDRALAILGGENHRFMFRKLAPFQGMAPHTDAIMPEEAGWRRFQLPLLTDPRITMRWPEDGEELHLEAGKLYEVRVDRVHEIVNNADVPRVHAQFDQVRSTV